MSDYSKLLETLRYCQVHPFRPCDGCGLFDTSDCINTLHRDAAAAIEELQAELAGSKDAIRILKHNIETKKPKRGKWVGVYPMVDTRQCSICGYNVISEEMQTPYCPWCGAKMEVQDG